MATERKDSDINFPLLNPLLIPNILQQVFDLVPPNLLGTCRLVCKQWNEESCRTSRQKIPVILFLKRMDKRLPPPQSSLALTKYMFQMMDTKDFPHSHFEFRQLLPHHNGLFDDSNDVMQCFLDRFGSQIKYLHVDIFCPDFQFNDLLRTVQTKLPSLETLSLTCHNLNLGNKQLEYSKDFHLPQVKHLNIETNRSREEDYLLKLLPDLFEMMPNIYWVSSSCNSLNPYAENPNVMAGVLHSIVAGFAPNLAKIDVLLKLTNEDIATLVRQTSFKPTDLLICFDESIPELTFYSLMKKFSETLETLVIKNRYEHGSPSDTFPSSRNPVIMKSLRELTLSSFFCASLPPLWSMPKLQKLTMNNLSVDVVFRSSIGHTENHPLRALDMRKCSNQDADTMQIIALAFKNLKTLSFDATDAALKVIYEHLPQLEVLNIFGEDNSLSELTDYGICGVNKEDCVQHIEGPNSEDTLPENRSPFHIGKLEKLRELKLEFQSMTDASVLFGIIYSRSLRTLTFGSPLITGKSLKAAVNKLEFLQDFNITLCTGDTISFETLCYVQEKIKANNGNFIIEDKRPGNRGRHV